MKESYLLERIIREDGLNSLIVNLYPGSEGYSLMLRDSIGKEVETIKLPYEVSQNIFLLPNYYIFYSSWLFWFLFDCTKFLCLVENANFTEDIFSLIAAGTNKQIFYNIICK